MSKRITHQECVRLNLAQIQVSGLDHILERHAGRLTRCVECDAYDFSHEADCKLAEEVEELYASAKDSGAKKIGGDLLGPLIYLTGPVS